MPAKEGVETGLSALKKSSDHESEKSREQQENHDKNVCDRRGEVAGHFTFRNGQNMTQRVCAAWVLVPDRRWSCDCVWLDDRFAHVGLSCLVSGSVMLRKTSSKRPSSVCNSSIFQCSVAASSPIARASSTPSPFFFKYARTVTGESDSTTHFSIAGI